MNNSSGFDHLALTSPNPLGFEITKADGIYLFDRTGKSFIDLISGICVNNIGHCNAQVIKAIKAQCDNYLHVMAYGEFIEKPQLDYAAMLTSLLPENLSSVYFVNSGTEAIEGALKAVKIFTGKTELISFENSYYGGTHGALSLAGNLKFKSKFRPLLPDVRTLKFNDLTDLQFISKRTACVVAECIQGEAGAISANGDYLKVLRKVCDDNGALLIFDEVQTGLGRTGTNFAFEHYNVIPDILVLAKALGGGMPLGAFIASDEIMHKLAHDTTLGQITTFGGHPVSCAAGLAALKVLTKEKLCQKVINKEKLFRQMLTNDRIIEIRGKGLMLALRFENEDFCQKVIDNCLKNGLVTDSFVFAGDCMRLSPPLIITEEQIGLAAGLINKSINQAI